MNKNRRKTKQRQRYETKQATIIIICNIRLYAVNYNVKQLKNLYLFFFSSLFLIEFIACLLE